MKLKRIMAMLLCVAMVLSTMGTVVFAEETTAVAKIGEQGYETLAKAADAAEAGDTVEVIADYTLTAEEAGEEGLTFNNVNLTAADGVTLTVEGTLIIAGGRLTDMSIEGSGTTKFNGTVNFYGDNSVTSGIGGSPFELIVNEGATLLISRFVLGYDRNITVYGNIEDAHTFDPTDKTPSLKFKSTSGVSVGGTDKGNITAVNAYLEFDSSSWKNSQATHIWDFENCYVSATSFGNNNAGNEGASWTVTFDDSVLNAKNYIKTGPSVTYNFTNGSVATTGSLRNDGVINIDATSSVTTTAQQNNKVNAVDEHGGNNGTINVSGTLTVGSNATTAFEMLGGTLNVDGGSINLGSNSLTLDADSKLTSSGDISGEITAADGAEVVISGGTYTTSNLPEEWVADGYELKDNGDGTFGIKGPVLSGEGTETDPYIINNLADLKAFRDDVNEGNTYEGKYVALTTNIDLSNEVWTPIGTSIYDKTPDSAGVKMFAGNFDGGNHTVTGLTSDGYVPDEADATNDRWHEYSFGLFGYVYGANISNIKLAEVDIECSTRENTGGTSGGGSGIAALIGYYYVADGKESVIKNCHVLSGTVSASNNMGGLIGFVDSQTSVPQNVDITIENCSNAADVTSEAREAGGIVGLLNASRVYGDYTATMAGTITFKDCVNTGDIKTLGGGGSTFAGGILGKDQNEYSNQQVKITFDGCENSGTITVDANGETHIAGIGSSMYSHGAWLVVKNSKNTGDIVVLHPENADEDYFYVGGLLAYAGVMDVIDSTSTGAVTVGTANGNKYIGDVQNMVFVDGIDDFNEINTGDIYYLNGGTSPEFEALVDDVANFGGNFTVIVKTAYKDGFEFGGWYDNETCAGAPVTAFTSGSDTYYAKWIVSGFSGAGTEENPFIINNSEQLKWLRDVLNTKKAKDGIAKYAQGQYFALGDDIDLGGELWQPIYAFYGVLDGRNYTISNFTCDTANGNGGLTQFMYGTMKDLTVSDVTATVGASNIFAPIASTFKGSLDNVHTKNINVTIAEPGTAENAPSMVGGMIAWDGNQSSGHDGTVKNCSVENLSVAAENGKYISVGGFVNVICRNLAEDRYDNNSVNGVKVEIANATDECQIGGFIAQTETGWNVVALNNCHVSGIDFAVSGTGMMIGGFIANPGAHTSVKNSTTKGTIDASGATEGKIGGFVADLGWNNNLGNKGAHQFTNCSADVEIISGGAYAGGFIGSTYSEGTDDMDVVFNGCSATNTVEGNSEGGFAGFAERGTYIDTTANEPLFGTAIGGVALTGADSITFHKSLEEAINAAVDGDVIVLLADAVLDKTTNITKSITINGNGKKITQSDVFTSNGANAMLDIFGGATVTFNGVTFDGIKDVAIMRTVNANVIIDNCVVSDCTQTVSQGLLRLACGNATITDSKFVNNNCTMVVSFGFDAANDTDVLTMDGCLFEGNTCTGTAVVYFAEGDKGTVKNTKFIDNTVTTSGNAATLYMGWGDGFEVSGCLFDGNEVTTSHATTKRFASAIFADGCTIENNAFLENSATRNGEVISTTVAVAAYYGEASVSSNYWNGGTPSYTVEYDRNEVEALDYYTSYDAETGTLADKKELVVKAGKVNYATLAEALEAAQDGDAITLLSDIALDETLVNTKKITLDLNGKTITGTDNTDKNFSLIDNRGELTITGDGKMTLTATVNSGWNRYSAVLANNPGGKLVVENGTFEHLGGTDMAYGIDNLTNGKGTYAETVINGGIIKSTYRGIRQFLNGVEAQNILSVNGGTVEGANKSIWMHDPNKNANTGTLTVEEGAVLNGDVYLYVTEGSTEWPVEVSIAKSAVNDKVIPANVPSGYEVALNNDYYTVLKAVEDRVAEISGVKYTTLQEAIDDANDGDTITILKDITDDVVIEVESGKNFILDLNKHTLGTDITVNNATVTFTGIGIVNSNITGDIAVEGGAFYGTITGTVNATGGSFPSGTKVIAGTGYHTVTMSDGRIAVAKNTEEATGKITLEFRPTTDKHIFEIVLVAEDGKVINEFVSAEFEFTNASRTVGGADMLYTVTGTDAITAVPALGEVNEAGAAVQSWGFAVADVEHHDAIVSGKEVKLGTVTFDGYGQINFSATAGVVRTTLEATNNEFHYITDGSIEAGNLLDITADSISGSEGLIEEIKRVVKVNVNFVNDITAGVDAEYNDMYVSITGEHPGYLGETKPLNVISNNEGFAEFTVTVGYRYTVTVKGAGYRTARYTTIIDEADAALDLNFWNNVKSGLGDPLAEIETGVSGLSAKNFLAGDIAMDNIIDKYDIAAAVSYFGTYELDANNKPGYAKYDLNRDGKIDSEDIAYVLYSVGE